MLTVDRNPPPGQLRSFGVLLAIFVPLFGLLVWWRTGRLQAGETIWVVGGLLTAVYWLVPAVRRPIYVGWMYAAFPIGWTVSHVLMGLIYYVVITPIGLIIRATGRDPLLRQFDRSARTYWTPHPPSNDVARYFRQY
jgi:protein-S-isoprenylcysteine O-methyltransferase Ste14